jgi:hypothetical protein
MGADIFSKWSNFFIAEAGASSGLAGLLFVAVSMNLGQILKFKHLPTRAIEALSTLLSILVVATFALVPDQTLLQFGIEVACTGLFAWIIQSVALYKTRHSGYETAVRVFLNQVPPIPFLIGGTIMALGWDNGMYWIVPGTLLSIGAGVYCAWVLLVEIQR